MNKLGIVLGVAAVAVVSGCKDPDYNREDMSSQNEVKRVPASESRTPTRRQAPANAQPIEIQTIEKCACPPGTKHETPCSCGLADCFCVVTPKAVAVKPVEPECTIYVVQNGDYLAKISKKYNVTIKSIKSLNNMKSDVIRVGQKIKLPGKIDVGEQKAPVVRKIDLSKPAAAPAAFTGATKEYVVKGGDTLGAIALTSGISVRQLKEMNGLSKDSIRVGQKLKVPAEKVVKPAKSVEKKADAKKAAAKPAEKKPDAKKADAKPEEKPAAAAPVEAKPAEPAPTAADENAAPIDDAADADKGKELSSYTVQEGEDIMSIVVKYGVTPAEIRELNNLGEDGEIKAGQVIKLPIPAEDLK